MEGPHITVTIENSKFAIKPKDAQRLNKMSTETNFSKILEAKVDMNYKIAKIVSNALNWEIDFNAFKSAKQVIMIPVDNEKIHKKQEQSPKRNENDLFNELEGRRRDFQLPTINEEKYGATSTNQSGQYKMNENYPLKQLKPHNEVLLVNYHDLKAVLTEKLGFRCDDSQTESMAIERVEYAIKQTTNSKKPFLDYIILDMDDPSVILDRFARKTRKLMADAGITHEMKLYAMSSQSSDKIKNDIKKAGYTYFLKPQKSEQLDLLRHMVPQEDLINVDQAKRKNNQAKNLASAHPSETSGNVDIEQVDSPNKVLSNDVVNADNKWKVTNEKIERENILDAKRKVIKETKQEVTLAQLGKEMLAGK